jgi:NAD(P)-dependent dehydrogenase (short-subunit alcohol dehydrogenase family)
MPQSGSNGSHVSGSVSLTLPEVVAVSGTASGLGWVLARRLASAGTAVVGVDVAPARPEALDLGDAYVHVQGDVSSEATWERVVNAPAIVEAGSLGLASCAAILEVGTLLDLPPAAWERTFAVNVLGTVLAMRALLPELIVRGGGPIVAVASVDATFAEQQLVSYCASKGAVLQLARTAALDHARAGVRVNVVSPGPMLAGLFERHLASADDPQKFLEVRSARQPNGRILDPTEVADTIVFLLSDESSGLTGANVVVDGGLTVGFDFRTGAEGASIENDAAAAALTAKGSGA